MLETLNLSRSPPESEAEGGEVQKENSDDGNKPNLGRMVIRHAMSPDTHRDLQIGGKDSKNSISMKNGLHEDHEQAVMEAIEMEAMRDMKLNGILDEDSSDEEDSEDELKIDEDYIDDDDDETNDENVNRNHQKSGEKITN
ncbi:hypothetical protein M8J76_009673 [Diaphorina citri]|nr:hypothetical protein M8J76_009673 [Diaphorina citri]